MKAIVFDNAGTILRRVTVLLNMYDKTYSYDTNTIDIVNQNINKVIIVFQTPTGKLIKTNSTIHQYLKDNPECFEISYSNKSVTKNEVINALNNDKSTINDIKMTAYELINKYDIEICSGSALIVDLENNCIDYVYTAGGMFFDGVKTVIQKLKEEEFHIYIASGDNLPSLTKIANILDIDNNNVYDTSNKNRKAQIVSNLQDKGFYVYMVGNQTNDELALQQADTGILTLEQKEKIPDYLKDNSDYVISHITEVIDIVCN
ncbi:MAG: HAD family hydrolase [Methanosphaera sp.]|nr:HAD family hydrolase [Methanosphaera sp.]